MTDNMRGALLMSGAIAAFTVSDALMKAVLAGVPVFEAQLVRGLGVLALLYIIARVNGGLRFDLSRRDWTFIAVRSVAEAISAIFYLEGLKRLPLAHVSALYQSVPLCLTLAGALFLGEKVGWRRMSAILVGFVGVLLIIRPGAEGLSAGAFLILGSIGMIVVRELCTRTLSPGAPSMTVALTMALTVVLAAVVGSVTTGDAWHLPQTLDILRMTSSALLVASGYLLSIAAMRVGDIAVVSPFRYTSMIWALLIGLVFFGSWPELPTLIGAVIVIAAGGYTIYRERQIAAGESRSPAAATD